MKEAIDKKQPHRSGSRDHERADDQHIHPGPQKAVEGFVPHADDSLVFIQ